MRLAIACLVLLAGCAVLQPGYEDSQVVREIVETAVDTLRATPEAQRERLAAAMNNLVSRPDDAGRLRAAVLLATLPRPLRDEARAAALMREISDGRPDTPLTQFAMVFQARLAAGNEARERLRSTEEREQALREQADVLRTNERTLAEREEALKRRTQALRSGERTLAEREETLRRQVEALRETERLMTEREETVRKQIEALRESERSMSEREGRLGTKTR